MAIVTFEGPAARGVWNNVSGRLDELEQAPILACLARGWPAGVVRETLNYGKPMSPFIIQIYVPGHGVRPHQDDIRDEVAVCPEAGEITAQFGLNLYLSMPEQGGECAWWLAIHGRGNKTTRSSRQPWCRAPR